MHPMVRLGRFGEGKASEGERGFMKERDTMWRDVE